VAVLVVPGAQLASMIAVAARIALAVLTPLNRVAADELV